MPAYAPRASGSSSEMISNARTFRRAADRPCGECRAHQIESGEFRSQFALHMRDYVHDVRIFFQNAEEVGDFHCTIFAERDPIIAAQVHHMTCSARSFGSASNSCASAGQHLSPPRVGASHAIGRSEAVRPSKRTNISAMINNEQTVHRPQVRNQKRTYTAMGFKPSHTAR